MTISPMTILWLLILIPALFLISRCRTTILPGTNYKNFTTHWCNEPSDQHGFPGPFEFDDVNARDETVILMKINLNVKNTLDATDGENGFFKWENIGILPLRDRFLIQGEYIETGSRPFYSCRSANATTQFCYIYTLKSFDAEEVPENNSIIWGRTDRAWLVYEVPLTCVLVQNMESPMTLQHMLRINVTFKDEFPPTFRHKTKNLIFMLSDMTAGRVLYNLTAKADDADIGIHGQIKYVMVNDGDYGNLIQVEKDENAPLEFVSHPHYGLYPWRVKLTRNMTRADLPANNTFRVTVEARPVVQGNDFNDTMSIFVRVNGGGGGGGGGGGDGEHEHETTTTQKHETTTTQKHETTTTKIHETTTEITTDSTTTISTTTDHDDYIEHSKEDRYNPLQLLIIIASLACLSLLVIVVVGVLSYRQYQSHRHNQGEAAALEMLERYTYQQEVEPPVENAQPENAQPEADPPHEELPLNRVESETSSISGASESDLISEASTSVVQV